VCVCEHARTYTYTRTAKIVSLTHTKSSREKETCTKSGCFGCDKFLTCWYDKESFPMSTGIVQIILQGIKVQPGQTILFPSLNSIIPAVSYTIQQWVFIIASFIRKKNYRNCIQNCTHKYKQDWVPTKLHVWNFAKKWQTKLSVFDKKRQLNRNMVTKEKIQDTQEWL
jgi:hypothetical protein